MRRNKKVVLSQSIDQEAARGYREDAAEDKHQNAGLGTSQFLRGQAGDGLACPKWQGAGGLAAKPTCSASRPDRKRLLTEMLYTFRSTDLEKNHGLAFPTGI